MKKMETNETFVWARKYRQNLLKYLEFIVPEGRLTFKPDDDFMAKILKPQPPADENESAQLIGITDEQDQPEQRANANKEEQHERPKKKRRIN
jgi:hypothetical protein